MDRQSTPRNFTLYPLLWLSVCFASGIAAAKYLDLDWKIWLAGTLIFGSLTALFLNRKPIIVLLALAFISLGAFSFQMREQSMRPDRIKMLFERGEITTGDPVEIEGILTSKPEQGISGQYLELEGLKMYYQGSERIVSGNVRYFAPARDDVTTNEYTALGLESGLRVRIAANLQRDESFLNPGVVSRLELMDQQEIDASAVIESPLLIEKMTVEPDSTPTAWVKDQRQNLIDEFRSKFSVSTAGVMIASLLGNKNFLDRPTAEVFREGGTFHVLVISGLHITFIGAMVVFFLRVFTKKRLWQFIIANVFLWAYTLAVGAQVPVARAAIMFTVLMLGQLLMRQGTLLNSLGACAIILLVWRPTDLFTASFQLTFLSVGAIVACAFPLIENLRRIGRWTPVAGAPFPARVPAWLKRFCEMLYWRDEVWNVDRKHNIWSAGLFKSPYLKWLEAKGVQGLVAYLFEGIIVSIIVQIWLLPLLVVYFNRFSFASILLNLWVGFFIALESFAAVIALLFAQVNGALALPLIKLTEALNWLLLSVPGVFVANDWASVRPALYSGPVEWVYILYFLPVLLLAIAANRWQPFAYGKREQKRWRPILLKTTAWISLALFLLIIFHPFSAPRPDGKLRVDFLDVGQGDSTLITFPDGQTLLIDAGGTQSQKTVVEHDNGEEETFEPDSMRIGESVVSRFLWQRGYSSVDYILPTHADTDHIQGLVDVAKNFSVRGALMARDNVNDDDFIALSDVLRNRGIPIVSIARGDTLTFEGVTVEVLYPETEISPTGIWDNDHSVVLCIIYGETEFLFTGDIEKAAEAKLLGDAASLRADVVKVAHHGSRTSSTPDFVSATGARYAIIPVGRRSRHGHPHKEVVERWVNSGAKVITTGEKGTVSIVTDGKEIELTTFLR